MIIGLCGFIGDGKDAAAEQLHKLGFKRASFAHALKDAVAAIFHWDRELLEGFTDASRAWRELVDPWWANRLGVPCLTPRWVLQHFGLGVCREHLHDEIWIASLERRLGAIDGDVVISDARFPNELDMIKASGGIVVRVVRGVEPPWLSVALAANAGDADAQKVLDSQAIHRSETAWVGYPCDHVVQNDGTLDDLKAKLASLIGPRGCPSRWQLMLGTWMHQSCWNPKRYTGR